jgi:hypothetical protein
MLITLLSVSAVGKQFNVVIAHISCRLVPFCRCMKEMLLHPALTMPAQQLGPFISQYWCVEGLSSSATGGWVCSMLNLMCGQGKTSKQQ